MFKNMRIVILFDMFPNPSFTITTSLANVARTTITTNKFIYQKRVQIVRDWVFI